MNRSFRASVFFLAACAVLSGIQRARAQCQNWQPGHSAMGIGGAAFASCVFDSGSGPALYVGGVFQSAGGDAIEDVAKWDGSRWSPLGLGTNGTVHALTVFDDGSGPALYVGGDFTAIEGVSVNHIARWDGARWSTLGVGADNSVDALTVFDDGSGPALYAGGGFTHAGGTSANRVAKWNGSSWSALGSGTDLDVYGMTVFDDGGGSALYASGIFLNAGGNRAKYVAKWNGSTWSSLGSGMDDFVLALRVFDDGTGQALYAGGNFTLAGGVAASRVAKWNGTAWSALSNDITGTVRALNTFDDGSGTALYAGGDFYGPNAQHISKWNGSTWSALGSGLFGSAHTLAVFDDGFGPALFVGGSFSGAVSGPTGLDSAGIIKWNGAHWAGVGGGTDSDVNALAVLDDGTGPALYAAGKFQSAGSTSANSIAKYKNGHWSPLGDGLTGTTFPNGRRLTAFDDGTGPALYVAGTFTNAGAVSANGFAKWNGSSWSTVNTNAVGGTFEGGGAMTAYDDGSGPALFASGVFTPSSGPAASVIAKYDGSAWTPIGGVNVSSVNAMIGFDDGTGPALFVAGSFSSINGVAANWIAKWNGSTWSSMGSGVDQGIAAYCLAVFDDGTGPALYVGGGFSTLRGVSAPAFVAKWNGTWSSVGSDAIGNGSQVLALQTFDDGSGAGTALYMAGVFYTLGGASVRSIARWNGSTWSPLGAGVSERVYALAVFDDGSGGGPDLWAGGQFYSAGGLGAGNFAQWQGCGRPGVPMCFGDGTSGACPCANNGMPAHGCNNSAATGGARLTSSGWTSLAFDSLKLTSSGELASAFSVFLQGTAEIAPAFFGDGLRCAGGNLKRLYTKAASSGVVFAPHAGDPSISARSSALGNTIAPGATRVYQVYYRDPSLTFCPSPVGNTWNVSNGLRIQWLP